MIVSDLPVICHEVETSDLVYREIDGEQLLGRLYRPLPAKICPLLLEVHGGAWVSKDRLLNADICRFLASHGIAVFSIDFRMPPKHRYPQAVIDINVATRWLKQNAQQLGTRPDWIGGMGSSSGGHLILLSALRYAHANYQAHDEGLVQEDASLPFVIANWPILDPLGRFHLMQKRGNQKLLDAHAAFWTSEQEMADANPQYILDRNEKIDLPRLLIVQGSEDENFDASMSEHFAQTYKRRSGEVELRMVMGAPHSFFNEMPDSAYTK